MLSIAASHDNSNERYFQPGSALNRILQEAPYYPRCSDNKTAALQRPREYAVRYPYMQINRRGFVSWLIFDLDHARAWAWDDAGLPPPNLVVQNRDNGKSHLYYAIVPVCTTEAARGGPIAYMKAIYEAMAARMDADASFHSGPVAKTPGHRWWRTSELHNQVYELSELADHVELGTPRPFSKTAIEDISHSRHMLLFEFVRHYAYAIVNREREQGNYAGFIRLVEAFAHNRNSFGNMGFAANLPLSSVNSTVKSITRWTWEHYTGCGRCHRGVMQLDKDLPLPVRQKLAALRTHDVRRKAAESKIRVACRVLKNRGAALTLAAIATIAKVTRQTVATYKHIINEVTAATAQTVTPITPPSPQRDVKYGAHQVTGGVPSVTAGVEMLSSAVNIFDDDGGG